jgi:prepilin-type N-terminal cleavage/methylation domain-containing protein
MSEPMSRDAQRGMTLVELLVAMAVTSILLVGVASVLFNVTDRYQDWGHRLQTASVGAALAASLQADEHRYVVCSSVLLNTFGLSDLELCAPDDRQTTVVKYTVTGSGPWTITRQQGSQAPTFLVRSDTQPDFWVDCIDNGSTLSGHVHVYNLRLPSDSPENTIDTFSVYYVAPRGPAGGC